MFDPRFIWLCELSKLYGGVFVLFLPRTALDESVVLREPLHIVAILLVKSDALQFDEVLHEVFPRRKMLRAFINQLERLLRLLDVVVFRVLVQAVHELHEVLLDQAEVLAHRLLQSLEGLNHKVLFRVLSGQSEDIDHDTPS